MRARLIRACLRVAAGAVLVIAPAVLLAQTETRPATTAVTADTLTSLLGTSLGPPGGEVRSLVQAPSMRERLYVGSATGHVFVSNDRGASWSELPLRLSHEAVVDNLLVHPANADLVYAAYWTPKGVGGIVRSDDAGRTWRELSLLGGRPSLRALTSAPSSPEILYAGGIGGVWRSDDGGETWRNANGTGLATEFVESLAVDPRDPDHVYAGTWRQVYESRDGGGSWRRIYQGMALDRDVFSLVISPHDPNTILAGTCNFLYCSNNAGDSWSERRSGLDNSHNRIHAIIHDPRDPSVLFAGTRGALYRSDDAGENWILLLPAVTVSALALDPEDGTLFVGTEERGVLIGAPGEGFAESNAGLSSARVAAFDTLPGSPRVLFAARSDGALESSLHYSTDLGRTWRRLGSDHGVGQVLALRAQASPLNRVIVAGQRGWYSVRPGGRWESIPTPPGSLIDLEIAHDAGGAVVALTDSGLYTAAATALVGSAGEALPFDGAATRPWQAVWVGTGLAALAVTGNQILAVGPDRVVSGSLDTSGIAARSDDSAGLPEPPRDMVLDPATEGVAYAITSNEVYRTTDGGHTWSRLPLPWPAADLRALAVDPAEPGRILALDYRGAIYRGHGQGQHWLVLDEDPGMHRAWGLHLSSEAAGFAFVATQGHGLRMVHLNPLSPATTVAPAPGDGSR